MIGVVTDSSCDLPEDLATAEGIGIVPLTIRFGTQAFADRTDLTTAEFWTKLATSRHLPETAAPSPGAFLEAFEGAGRVEGILCLCLSSELSGTYQSAVLAAEQAGMPVKVLDTRVVSMALGLVAITAARGAAAGGGLDVVAAQAANAARRANVFAALDTLDYLERGGRVGRVSALLGGLLDIKPLITLDDGVVATGGRVRTRSRVLAALTDHLAERDVERAAVLHSGSPDVERLVEALSASTRDLVVAELGPVVGTHTGPGVLGVAYLER